MTGAAAGIEPVAVLSAFGKAFNDTRYVTVIWVMLPVIGLLERFGLRERARGVIASGGNVTAAKLLAGYMLFRQLTAALGLTSIAGQTQTVRPLLAPMAEAAAERQAGGLDEAEKARVRALAAATDNVGLFFGEDIFLAIGSILLMKGLLDQAGIVLQPLAYSVWAIPTAVAAFAIHGARLWRLDRRLSRQGTRA